MTVITPTSMVAGGDALARDEDGRVVFVGGGLPGESLDIEIVETHRDFSRARIRTVLEPSPLRVGPPCPEVDRGCGGCQWQHITLAGQRTLKVDIVRDALRRIAHLDDPPVHALVELPDTAYRTTVRAAVHDERAGYRSQRSHDVVTVGSCLVVHPLIGDLLVNARYGDAREVVLRCGARTGDRLAAPTPSTAIIDVPDDARRNHFHEEAAGRRWRVSARSFFQPSPEGADALAALIAAAAAHLPAGHAVDLYGGVGLFAGVLAARGWRTTSVEGSSTAVADALANLDATVCAVVRADVVAWPPLPADLVVADPSRAGLRREGVAVIEATGAPRAVLVSCDPAALARDTGLLLDAGYRLTAVTPVDLFPHSFHIETVSVFDR